MKKSEISAKIQQNLYDINYWLSRNINPVDRDSIILFIVLFGDVLYRKEDF